MNGRLLVCGLATFVVGLLATAYFALASFENPAVDPAWALSVETKIPEGSVTVRYTGTSTLLCSDGETDWMLDGWAGWRQRSCEGPGVARAEAEKPSRASLLDAAALRRDRIVLEGGARVVQEYDIEDHVRLANEVTG